MQNSRAISRPKQGSGAGCLALFFGVFLLAGIGLLPFLGRPVIQVIGARSWPEVPCTILESGVKSHEGSDSTTYSVAVRYEYEVDGRLYRSDRYRFMGGSSSGYDGKAEVVAGLPVGSKKVCYVDPKDPSRAVLDRSLGAWVLLSLIPLGLIAGPLWGIVWAVRNARGKVRRPSGPPVPGGINFSDLEPYRSWLPEPRGAARVTEGVGAAGDGGLELKPSTGPVAKLVGITCIALFWNGIVSLFLKDVVAGWKHGQGDGCHTLFLVPFVVIGLGLLISIPYQILALFNPRPRLILDRSRLRPGEAARLSWSFSGAAGRIRRLKISLEGREEASYRQGTTTHTDRSTFATLVLFESDLPSTFASGEIEVVIPSGSMHSFSASHNKIVWKLMIAGEIARWPDVGEEFDLVVLPETPRRV
ncbi:MAG TPA: DUF3592 domain-containing protein [Thermoanaerobaculia bacterium]|jgi:hypothetical protein|nr:DUF3592 domain-containing protein [Thermoanaerobaculia bacterium]